MSILQLLDEWPEGGDQRAEDAWFAKVARSLEQDAAGWTSAIRAIGELSDEHAWILLSWIEVAASHAVRTRSRNTLVTAAFAMALVLQSGLDRRDCSIVASLLRRAAHLNGFGFRRIINEGCDRAGAMGREARTLLRNASAETPETHVESGSRETFVFAPRPPSFDVAELEEWLEGDGS